ncbi:hypothetical protein L1987_46137 [Smallanthus sonchifolius]|uniref:Uncharacterized protein n=1 Tax=Smallanthus sonchifolius TaxID=185202 RepID=A0ACB9FYZ2_9ASTR|nr:hypothetical protein L1987_46137 [Smallanthus sonchifolius]
MGWLNVEITLSLKLLTFFWDEAINTACYVQNRVILNKHHQKTSYEIFYKQKPKAGHFRAFGCLCTLLHTETGPKFDEKADECYFMGYSSNETAYCGFYQQEGIDYEEVFAPVAQLDAIRIFLAYASFKGITVYQMDVAFLYGTLQEEIYVCQYPRFEDSANPEHVYKLDKALYGLHQAPHDWYATLIDHILANCYTRGAIDQTLFWKRERDELILVQIYVDDIIFGSTSDSFCKEFENVMKQKFEMSSMGEMTFFLGLQVKQDASGILIHQGKHVNDILAKFHLMMPT